MKENKEIDLVTLFKTVWSQRNKLIKWGMIGLVVGIVIAFSIPKQYTSTMKLAPEKNAKPLSGSAGALASMMGLGGNSNVDGISEKLYPIIITSTPFVLEFADIEVECNNQIMPLYKFLLENQKRTWWSYVFGLPSTLLSWVSSIGKDKANPLHFRESPAMQYAFAGVFGNSIKLSEDPKTGVFTLTSVFQDSKIAKTVADTIFVKLQEYMNKYSTSKTRNTLESNIRMLENAKKNYYEIDQEYASAIDRNQNLISKIAMVKVDRLKEERELSYQIYQQIAMQVETDKIKLQEEKSIATLIEPPTVPISPSAPNKIFIVIALAFVGAFFAAIKIIITQII